MRREIHFLWGVQFSSKWSAIHLFAAPGSGGSDASDPEIRLTNCHSHIELERVDDLFWESMPQEAAWSIHIKRRRIPLGNNSINSPELARSK